MKTNTYDLLIRVSAMGKRDADDESTRTIDDQQRAGHTTAKSKGGRIGKTYEMLDQSGSTVLPKIQDEIIERVRSGKSAGLIVAYSDRLCRNAEDGIAFLGSMGRADAELWDATSPDVDYRDDDGRLVWLMKMVVNEIPSRAAKKRGQRLADELIADGIPTKVSFGYRRNADAFGVKTDPDRPDKSLVVDEATAPVVCRIFAMRRDALSWVLIADTLNDEGIPSPSGKRWGPSSVAAVIANEVYTGVVKSGTRRCENAHEAIIPAAQWRAVQSTIKQTRTGKLVAGIAGGLLRCQTCGLTLSVVGTGRDGRAMYGCRRRSATGKCSRPVYVTKDAADDFIEERIIELIESGEGVDLVASAREIEAARLQLDAAREQRKAFVKLADALDEDDFRDGYAERKQIEDAASEHYDDLLSHASHADTFPTSATAWRLLDDTRKRDVARSLIVRVAVSPPANRSPNTPIEDRFQVVFVGGAKLSRARWEIAA